ncbi:hypothetical protein like AT5G48500 [Hibiscus trionum]|uniref:RIN4 pathogenic type III effector avirulence factor Avr cleavage site domain-containing protein n=1 Tax=Hibiscus trionum TaxID=183268 RepID=A0A9W7LRN4_HIBTR|nr:hypothetical protein like AT5G48500 [Hibiscus trionum]
MDVHVNEYYRRRHVPAFGSWDWNSDADLPFTQCFESARQAGLLRYTYSRDRDLYVAGDLYENHVLAPAMIVVPRTRGRVRESHNKEDTKKQRWEEAPNPRPRPRPTPKPVDEDLYKISPDLLYAKPKKKRGLSFLSRCLVPTCVL